MSCVLSTGIAREEGRGQVQVERRLAGKDAARAGRGTHGGVSLVCISGAGVSKAHRTWHGDGRGVYVGGIPSRREEGTGGHWSYRHLISRYPSPSVRKESMHFRDISIRTCLMQRTGAK